MIAVLLCFALCAALLLGALLTIIGAVGLVETPRFGANADLRPLALGVGVFGLVIFIAAACAILGTIGGA